MGRMSLGAFYKECARRAGAGKLARAKAWQWLAAFGLGFGSNVLALWWPAMSEPFIALGWAPFAVFAAVFAAGVVVDFIRAPHQLHEEAIARAEAAEASLADSLAGQKPKLEFSPDQRDGALLLDRKKRQSVPFKLGVVPVRNASTSDGVNARLVLVSFQPEGKQVVPVRQELVADSQGYSTVRIGAQTTEYFRLVRLPHGNNRAFLAPVGETGELGGQVIYNGRFKLELRITPDDGLPVRAFYLLEVSAGGSHKLHLWPDDGAN